MSRQIALTLAFSGTIAALVILIGPGDLESYDTAFFSLDRHGSLGASPVRLCRRFCRCRCRTRCC
jgi:hypothetical protein